MKIERSTVIETAMADPDTHDIDKTLEDAWAPYMGRTPEEHGKAQTFFDLYCVTEESFMLKVCRYIDAAFLAGYKLGRNPGALIDAALTAVD